MKWTTKFKVYERGVFIAFFGGLVLLIVGLVGIACGYASPIFFWFAIIGAILLGFAGPLSLPLHGMAERSLLMKKK